MDVFHSFTIWISFTYLHFPTRESHFKTEATHLLSQNAVHLWHRHVTCVSQSEAYTRDFSLKGSGMKKELLSIASTEGGEITEIFTCRVRRGRHAPCTAMIKLVLYDLNRRQPWNYLYTVSGYAFYKPNFLYFQRVLHFTSYPLIHLSSA